MGQNVLEQILEGSMKPTDLPLETLREITNNFSIERVIGWGGFGTVYKGVLRNGNVAVKRIMSSMTINEKLFRREVDSLMEVNHQNVVRFLGFCSHTVHTPVKNPEARGYIYAEIRERLLCFEYISNGSLDKYITDELRGLDWDTRFQIIKGICMGLCYLHMEKHILHMDLKPANILLDNQMVPKITDFGLSRPTENSQTTSTNNFCSPGYAAPENMFLGGRMLVSSDIYSLGAIIIELVTGHKGVPDNHSNVLRRWRHRWKKSAREMQLSYQKQITKCIEIGLLCQAFDPIKRPFISNIVSEIGEMESMNNHIKDADEPIVDQINPPYWDDDMLGIEPLELRFANFEHNNKQILSCSVELSNDTGGFIAFEIRTTSPLPYSIEPNNGIVGPQSKFIVDITMQNDMATLQYSTKQYTEDFIVRSIKVDEGLATEDINQGIFDTDMVDEVRLTVSDNQLGLTCVAEEPKEIKSSVDIVYQKSYPHVQSPMFSPVQARCDWSVLGNKNHQVIPSEVPARNIDHDYGGRISLSSSNQLRKDDSAQASQHDSHAVQFDFDTQSQNLPLKGLSRGYVLDDSVDAEDQHVREHSTQWGSGDSPNLASGLEEASPSYPYLPAVPEDPGSSFSEAAKDDPLPGIEGLRITGEAFPGRVLQASGFSTKGTTSCNFVWVRHLDDGSVKFIEGARQPNHLVTADDVDTLLAVEVQPLDDRKRKGDIVKVYANKQAKVACDPQTKELIKRALEVGHVSYQVQLPVRFLDMWEPAVLEIKREGYSIKCNGQRGVVLMEKFQHATAINIPYGYERATEFSIVSADGAEYTLQPAENMLSRDTIVLVLRLFKSSSLSEVTEDDPLPGIEGLRIVGEAFPGQELQASGFSTGGTTSCNFEWVRHFEDGSIKFIDGARQPNYLVTADDVNTLLSVELQPLDDRKRKGDIVKVYANEQAKITCAGGILRHVGTSCFGNKEGRLQH